MADIDLNGKNESAEAVGVRTTETTGLSTHVPLQLSVSGDKAKFLEGLDEEARVRDFHTSQFLNTMVSAPTGGINTASLELGTEESELALSAVENGEQVAAAAVEARLSAGSTIESRAKLKSQIMHAARAQNPKSSFKPNQEKKEDTKETLEIEDADKLGIAKGEGIESGIAAADKDELDVADREAIPLVDKEKIQDALAAGDANSSILENPLATDLREGSQIGGLTTDTLMDGKRDDLLATLKADGLEELGLLQADSFTNLDTEEFFAAFELRLDEEFDRSRFA